MYKVTKKTKWMRGECDDESVQRRRKGVRGEKEEGGEDRLCRRVEDRVGLRDGELYFLWCSVCSDMLHQRETREDEVVDDNSQ